MKKTINILALLFFCIFSYASQKPLVQNTPTDAEIENRINEYVKSFMDAYQVPGLALAVVKNNRIFFSGAYGFKNIETKEPLTTKSIFHWASVSKPFVATAIMQLVEKGKMKLDDPLVKHLPYFKLDDPRYKEITIKQMLTHTSGIPDVHDYEWYKPQVDDGAAERYVRSLANEKMIGAPGEIWRYSNMSFDILADVIDKVSGMTFEDYIKENIFIPLGMKESDFLRERISPELRMNGHVFNLSPQVSEVYPYNRIHAPSSCLNSNVLEMCNWAIANMNKGEFKGARILDESSYKILFEPQFQINNDRSIGLSWILSRYKNLKTVWHNGADLGFRSQIVLFPEKSMAIMAVSNYAGTPITDLTYGVINIMFGFEPALLAIPINIPMGKRILDDGIQKAIQGYWKLKKNHPDDYNFSENQLNDLGYALIRNNRMSDAIGILKLNTEVFPNSANAYDSLAEAYMLAGNKELAIKNYEKSFELNPQNINAVEQLKKLRVE